MTIIKIKKNCDDWPFKGSYLLFTDLSLAIDLPLRIDFMVASSYGSGTETSGNVDIRLSCSENIEGCHVLLVDDIIDSGVTMEAITRLLMAQKPAPVKKLLCAISRAAALTN